MKGDGRKIPLTILKDLNVQLLRKWKEVLLIYTVYFIHMFKVRTKYFIEIQIYD